MDILSIKDAVGHRITLKRTDPRHIAAGPKRETPSLSPEEGFGKLFFKALSQVNDLQHKSMNMTESLLTDPDSVNVHDVTIALAEANLALSMTKTIMDRAVRAYREILSVR